MVARPTAFLMDEPLSNLDAKLRAQTRVELVELHRRLATTFVYVTHDQVEAMTMADRMAILEGGRLQQVGAPQSVYDRPQNLFVARFVGSPPMNTFPGVVVRSAGPGAVEVDGQRLDGPEIDAAPVADGAAIMIGVRPEHLVIDPDGPLRATVAAVEWLGHERLVACELGSHPITIRQASSDQPVAAGDTLPLRAEPGSVHLFDPESTERVN